MGLTVSSSDTALSESTPGDKIHRLKDVVKVTSGSTPKSAEHIDQVYAKIIDAGTHKASSIRVAEASKVIENTQRDVNIGLINELAMICDRLDLDTTEVIEAAKTKWNFLPFAPGLVGGHCIGVDPYYPRTCCYSKEHASASYFGGTCG